MLDGSGPSGPGLIAVVAAGVTAPMLRATRDAEWRQAYRIENPTPPAREPMADEGAGAASPFAPSSATTNTGGTIPADFFLTSESCGRCHRDIYDQWNSSAHHFSSFNNQWYRRSIEYMQDVVGTTPSKWCAGCHDPRGVLQRSVRAADPRTDRHTRGTGRSQLHLVPCHRPRRQLDGSGRVRHRVSPVARSGGQRQPGPARRARPAGQPRPRSTPRHLSEAVPPRPERRVLLHVPQGAPGHAGERLPLDPRVQRVRQLAGIRRLRPGRPLRSITRTRQRPATPATCRSCGRTTPRRTTATCARTGSPQRTRRSRSSTGTPSSSRSYRISCAPIRSQSTSSASPGWPTRPPWRCEPCARASPRCRAPLRSARSRCSSGPAGACPEARRRRT